MSNQSNKDALEKHFGVELDTDNNSKRPQYTLDNNGDVQRSAQLGHPSGRTVDPNIPSRTTDPRPGISGVQATNPRPGISGVQAPSTDFKKSKATSDLKSGPESGTQLSRIFSNPSAFQTYVQPAGSNFVFGKLRRDSASEVNDADPVSDQSKSSYPKKKSKFEPDSPSPPSIDYLSEADSILLDLEEFDRTCETKCRQSRSNPSHSFDTKSRQSRSNPSHSFDTKSRQSRSNPSHGSMELISNSKWSNGKSSTSIKDKPSIDDADSDFDIDELLAYYLDDPAQDNRKTVPETSESSVVTAKPQQAQQILARPKKVNRKMRDPDPQVTEYLARKEDIRIPFKVPIRRPTKTKQWEVTETDHYIDETEPSTSLEPNDGMPRPDTPVPSASYVCSSPSALEEFTAMHRAQPPAILANQKKLMYTHDNVIPTLPIQRSPSPPTALDDFAAMTRTMPHPLLANQKKLKYTHDNVIPTLPIPRSPTPPTALDEFAAMTRTMPHPLLANQKKLKYTNDNVIPTLPTRRSPSPPTALDDFAATLRNMPHPLLANQKKLKYTHDNVIPTLPIPRSTTPPTALDEFAAMTRTMPHPLLANQKKLKYTNDNVIPTLPTRCSPSPPTALDDFAAMHQAMPHPLLANQKKLVYTNDNVIPTLPIPRSPTPPTALDDFASKFPAQSQTHFDNPLSTNSSQSSTSIDEFSVIHNNRIQAWESATQAKPSKRPVRLPPLKNAHSKVTYDIFGRKLDDPATLHMPRRVPDKLDFSSKKNKKSETDENFSSLRDDDDRPVVTETVGINQSRSLSQSESQPTFVIQGYATSDPQETIPNIRNVIIGTNEKKQKKSVFKKLIPCIKSSQDEDKGEIDHINYFEVKEIKIKPPKKLKTRLYDRLVTVIHTIMSAL